MFSIAAFYAHRKKFDVIFMCYSYMKDTCHKVNSSNEAVNGFLFVQFIKKHEKSFEIFHAVKRKVVIYNQLFVKKFLQTMLERHTLRTLRALVPKISFVRLDFSLKSTITSSSTTIHMRTKRRENVSQWHYISEGKIIDFHPK
jgi:hypothetical protein